MQEALRDQAAAAEAAAADIRVEEDDSESSNRSQQELGVLVREEQHQEHEEELAQVLPSNMSFDDPRRMLLTQDELGWAFAIKGAVEGTAELDNLSDFMYAQLAIICKDNLEDAVHRAYALQSLREEYGILESLKAGCQAVRDLVKLQPGWLLAFYFDPTSYRYTVVDDNCCVDTTVVNTPDKVNRWFAGMYFLHHAGAPDLQAVRRGVNIMAECEGTDWTKKQNFGLIKDLNIQLCSIYPFTGPQNFYHTGIFFNVMLSIWKKLWPKEERWRFKSGLICDCRLDTVCMVPTVEAGTQRLIAAMEAALKLRYANERAFSLERLSGNLQ